MVPPPPHIRGPQHENDPTPISRGIEVFSYACTFAWPNRQLRPIVFETVHHCPRAHPTQEVTWPRELYLNVLGCKALVPQSAVGEGGPLTATASVTTDGENGDAAGTAAAAAGVVLSGVGGDIDAKVNPERATPPPGMSRKLSYVDSPIRVIYAIDARHTAVVDDGSCVRQ